MRAIVSSVVLLLSLSVLLPPSAQAQRRRRPATGAARASSVDFEEQAIRGVVRSPRFDANALWSNGRSRLPNVARARRALALLERGDRSGALEELEGIDPAVEPVEVSYVVAWARFVNGDFTGAVAALAPALRRVRLAQSETFRNELAWMYAFTESGVAELSAQLRDDSVALAVAERMIEPLIGHGELERAAALLAWIGGRARGRQLATALEREALVDFARGSPNVGAIRLAEAIAIARSAGDTAALATMRARALEAAERADRAWTEVRDGRSRIAATVLYRVWLRSGGGPQAASVEAAVRALERPTAAPTPAAGVAIAPVRAAIDLRLGDVRGCYERALVANPALRGRVVLRFLVTPAGEVTDATIVSSSAGLEATGSCIATRAARWRVPAGARRAPVAITYPFALSPAN